MISHRWRCIFIHQRKCAGSSIISSFGFTTKNPEWHFMNDGILSPEYGDRPRGYLTFAVVRNPWDRFVSGWKYCECSRRLPLLEALQHLPQEGHDYRHLTRPQHATICLPDGTLAVDRLLRFESLQQDFDALCAELGRPARRLPRVNVGQRGAYGDYFDAEAKRLFWPLFGRDAELFGYSF